MCVESGEKNDNVNVEEKFGIVQVFSSVFCISLIIYLERTCADINCCFLLTGVYRDRRCWYPALS